MDFCTQWDLVILLIIANIDFNSVFLCVTNKHQRKNRNGISNNKYRILKNFVFCNLKQNCKIPLPEIAWPCAKILNFISFQIHCRCSVQLSRMCQYLLLVTSSHFKYRGCVLVSAKQADIETTIFVVPYMNLVSMSSCFLVGVFIIVFSIYSLMPEQLA